MRTSTHLPPRGPQHGCQYNNTSPGLIVPITHADDGFKLKYLVVSMVNPVNLWQHAALQTPSCTSSSSGDPSMAVSKTILHRGVRKRCILLKL